MRTVGRPVLRLVLLGLALAACGRTSGRPPGAAPPASVGPGATTTGSSPSVPIPSTTAAPVPTATTTRPSTGPRSALCAALGDVRIYDVEASRLLDHGAPWPTSQRYLVTRTPAVLKAFDRAIASAPGPLVAVLKVLRAYSVTAADEAAKVSSLADFDAKLGALPSIYEAAAAGTRLDTFARSTCGFSTTGL